MAAFTVNANITLAGINYYNPLFPPIPANSNDVVYDHIILSYTGSNSQIPFNNVASSFFINTQTSIPNPQTFTTLIPRIP
jgi:hypothetical protein